MLGLQKLSAPPGVKELFSSSRLEAGFSGSYAWAFSRTQLVLWEPGNPSAQQLAHRLPYASSSVRHFVGIALGQDRLAVLLVSEDGNAALWQDFGAASEPLASRIPGQVTALAATGTDGLLAAAGMEDGSVHLFIEGTGREPTWAPLKQRSQSEQQGSPTAAPGATSGSMLSGLFGRQSAKQQPDSNDGALTSKQPVVGLHFGVGLAGAAAVEPQLLVLRSDCLECWDAAQGRLLCSSPLAQAIEGQVGQGPVTLLALAAPPTSASSVPMPAAAVVASCRGGLYVVTLSRDGWQLGACHQIATEPVGAGARLHAELAASAGGGKALVWEQHGQGVLLNLSTGKGTALDSLTDPLLAATPAPEGDAWLLLDSSGTLHLLPAKSSRTAEQQGPAMSANPTLSAPDAAPLGAGPGSARATDAVFQVLNAACQGQLGLASMAQQLSSLGALRGAGPSNPICKFSRHVLDTLPKIMAIGAGGETVGDQLQGKLALHNVLLQCLSDSGCLVQLHPLTLRAIFTDGAQLAALSDLRELESRLQEQRKGAGAEGLPFPLHEVAVAAGRRCMGHVQGGGDRSPWEVFYACPSVTVSAFFREVAEVAASLAGAPGAGAQQMEAVAQLARAVQVALGGATQQRAQYQQWFPHPASSAAAGVDEPEWVVGSEVRAAVRALAEACIRLHPLLSREAPSRVADCVSLTFDLAERLLNAYAATLAAVSPTKRRDVNREYDAVRDSMLGHLLRHAMLRCRQGAGDGESLLQRAASLAEAHAGYSLLFDACEFLGDRERLYELMACLTGDELTEPMAVYVFQRLLSEGRRSELLDLPPQFDADLTAWLGDESAPDAAQRLQIRWLHDLRVGDYGGAALSMASLSSTQQLSVHDAQRLLALDKLAAWAASPAWPTEVAGEVAGAAEDADAKLGLLELQARLGDSPDEAALLDVRSLMEAALQPERDPASAEVALAAYASADPTFRQQHRGVFDAAWLRLAGATNWGELAAARPSSTDEEFRGQVAAQPLFAAAALCYSGEGALLASVVPPEEVYATLDQNANKLADSTAAREVMLAAFQAGCCAPAGSWQGEEVMAD